MVLTLPSGGRGCIRGVVQRPGITSCRRTCKPSRRALVASATAAALHLPDYDSPDYNVPSTSGSEGYHGLAAPLPACGPDLGYKVSFSQHYVRGQLLGQGSFGTVFRGVALQTGSEVAIKVMPKLRGKLSKDATLEKICREVDFLERLQGCRGIVDVQDCFEEQDEVYVVTELLAGGDLQRLTESHPSISERCLALIAVEVLKTIKVCNDHGVVHGDIKPANFVLKHPHRNPLFSLDPAMAAASWLKAIDFGCSQSLPALGSKLSKRAGTPVFMAPEIFARCYAREADVWSAGVLLYQVFCKRFPFWDTYEAAKASRIDEIADAVCNADIRLDFGPWLGMSAEGRHFIKGLLTRNPEERMTVQQALAHPWLTLALGPAAPSGARRIGNNIVRSPVVGRSNVARAV